MAGATDGVHFLDSDPVGVVRRERPQRLGFIQRLAREMPGQRSLDHLDIAAPGSCRVDVAGALDRLFIERTGILRVPSSP